MSKSIRRVVFTWIFEEIRSANDGWMVMVESLAIIINTGWQSNLNMTGIEGMVVYVGGFGAGVAGGAILSEIQYEAERAWIARNLGDDREYVYAYVWSVMAEVGLGVCAVALFLAAAAEQNAEVAGFAVGFLAHKLRWRAASRQLLPGK